MNPFVRMYFRRLTLGNWLVFVGALTLVLGILLLLVRLVIALAYLATVIALIGLVTLAAGLLLTRSKRRPGGDDMPYY